MYVMDRVEAYKLARDELGKVEEAGFAAASEHIDMISLKDVSAPSGKTFEIELSYLWKDTDQEEILAICRVTSKSWFEHERLEESITLCTSAI
jgi:hypothetical protein